MSDKFVNKTDGKFNHGKWIREKSLERPLVNERIDRSTMKRMDGLHNTKYMKTFLDSASLLYQGMEEEGFEGQDIYEYLAYKLTNTNL